MSAFYKMDPAAWDFGTTHLSLEEEAAYLRIINAIHKHDQALPDNDRVLAGMFRCSTRKARSLVLALFKAGKIQIEGGMITNEKAISDLVRRGLVSNSRAESGAKGGRTRAENAAKSLENNDQVQAIASSRIEENREERKEAKASKRKASCSSLLPDGWTLPIEWREAAIEKGLSGSDADHEGIQFANHHQAKGSRMVDWRKAWGTWIGNHAKWNAGKPKRVQVTPRAANVSPEFEMVLRAYGM